MARLKAKYVFRALLGILFLFSGISKLISIDSFELYVFSFGILNLEWSFVISRLLICAEFTLGILLIANIYAKLVSACSALMLFAFSGLLVWLMVKGSNESCHCFGDLLPMDPKQSLIKNILLLVVCCVSFPFKDSFKLIKWKTAVAAACIIAPIAVVFIVSVPDNFRYDSYKSKSPLNTEAFNNALSDSTMLKAYSSGKRIFAFVSVYCEHCNHASRKLAILRKNGHDILGNLGDSTVVAVIGYQDEIPDTKLFFKETRLDCADTLFLPAVDFLTITKGKRPLFVVTEDGRVVQTYGYRDLH